MRPINIVGWLLILAAIGVVIFVPVASVGLGISMLVGALAIVGVFLVIV